MPLTTSSIDIRNAITELPIPHLTSILQNKAPNEKKDFGNVTENEYSTTDGPSKNDQAARNRCAKIMQFRYHRLTPEIPILPLSDRL